MSGYTFTVTCLHCESVLEHNAGSAAHPRMRSVVAACTACGSQYRLNVELLVLNGPAMRETLPRDARLTPARGRPRPLEDWPTFEELNAQVKPVTELPWQAEVDAVLRDDDAEIARARKERKRLDALPIEDAA